MGKLIYPAGHVVVAHRLRGARVCWTLVLCVGGHGGDGGNDGKGCRLEERLVIVLFNYGSRRAEVVLKKFGVRSWGGRCSGSVLLYLVRVSIMPSLWSGK